MHPKTKLLLDELRAGTQLTAVELARKHDVSRWTVLIYAKQARVKLAKDREQTKQSTYDVVAALLRGESGADIARRLSYSETRIAEIRRKMIQSGVYEAAGKKP